MREDSEPDRGDEGHAEVARLRALARVVPALAHRLNNGLMAVTGLGELVLTRPDSPAVARVAATADTKGREAVRSIKALSELAKAPEGERGEVDVREALRSVELLLDPLAESVGARLELEAPDELPTRADPRALLHRLVRLGVAALAGERPRLRLRVRRAGAVWVVDVLGTGAEEGGAPPLDGAEVGVRRRGRLVRTRLRLPALGAPPQAAASATGAPGVPRPRVLLVEEDAGLAELVEAVLAEGGFAPTVAPDGEAARAAARGGGFALALIRVGERPREQLAALELARRLAAVDGLALGVVGGAAVAERLGVPRALAPDYRPGELLDYVAERLASARPADGGQSSPRTSSGGSSTRRS